MLAHHPDPLVAELVASLDAYFGDLGLQRLVQRFPAGGDKVKQRALREIAGGFKTRFWRNDSRAKRGGKPFEWERIAVDQEPQGDPWKAIEDGELEGFLQCFCIKTKCDARTVFTPVCGAWVAASAEEKFADRELKGVFSWRRFSDPVRREVQLAFLLRMLVDAGWWRSEGDRTHEHDRLVSIACADLSGFPLETFELLNRLPETVAPQHWQTNETVVTHKNLKCPCQALKDHPDSTSHLILALPRLKTYLRELDASRRRTTGDPLLKLILAGRASPDAKLAVKQAADKIENATRVVDISDSEEETPTETLYRLKQPRAAPEPSGSPRQPPPQSPGHQPPAQSPGRQPPQSPGRQPGELVEGASTSAPRLSSSVVSRVEGLTRMESLKRRAPPLDEPAKRALVESPVQQSVARKSVTLVERPQSQTRSTPLAQPPFLRPPIGFPPATVPAVPVRPSPSVLSTQSMFAGPYFHQYVYPPVLYPSQPLFRQRSS